jgi:hypothetical protein
MWGGALAEFGGYGGCGVSLSKHHRWNGMEEINTRWLAGCGMYIVTSCSFRFSSAAGRMMYSKSPSIL